MTDQHYNWRLLSESFDRELSDEEQNLLDHFLAERASPRGFKEFLNRLRDCSTHQEPILNTDFSLSQRLRDQEKNALQRLIESELEKQGVPLSNRDVVFACELVREDAVGLGELTEKISRWNSESTTLSEFLINDFCISDADFAEVDSRVSDAIFSQQLGQTLLDEVVAAIQQRVPDDDCTVFEDVAEDFDRFEFMKLLDRTSSGQSGAFELLLDCLANESRSVILLSRLCGNALRLKPIVDEVTLRLIGRKKLGQVQFGCYYRNVGIAIRKLFEDDPELGDSLLPSIGNRRINVKQVVDFLMPLADEDPRFVQMFSLRFFAGLTASQVASLLELTEQQVSVECGCRMACLLQLIDE